MMLEMLHSKENERFGRLANDRFSSIRGGKTYRAAYRPAHMYGRRNNPAGPGVNWQAAGKSGNYHSRPTNC